MKKVISLIILLIMAITFTNDKASANVQSVNAEKLWTVSLNSSVLNTNENLSKIKVETLEGVEVPVKVSVNVDDNRKLEVMPHTAYELNETYSLVIPVGFESKQGLQTTEEATLTFTIYGETTTDSLSGEWTTAYTYRDILWNIHASFDKGDVNLTLKSGPTTHRGVEEYEINDGWMKMEVSSLNLSLSGQLQMYTDTKFKIVTQSGKVAYFNKVQ